MILAAQADKLREAESYAQKSVALQERLVHDATDARQKFNLAQSLR